MRGFRRESPCLVIRVAESAQRTNGSELDTEASTSASVDSSRPSGKFLQVQSGRRRPTPEVLTDNRRPYACRAESAVAALTTNAHRQCCSRRKCRDSLSSDRPRIQHIECTVSIFPGRLLHRRQLFIRANLAIVLNSGEVLVVSC